MNSTSNTVKDEMFHMMHENVRSFPGKMNLGASFISLLLTIKTRKTLLQ
jgi:hypothetical protein